MEKEVEADIASFKNECSIDMSWISNYAEHWRLILWDKAFQRYFDDKGVLKFIKGLDLMEFEEGPIAMKRVAYL